MSRADIIRMAREAGLCTWVKPPAEVVDRWERFAELVIADFLQRTGQYLTNDASREAVISAAVAEEREACRLAAKNAVLSLGDDRGSGDLCHEAIDKAIRAR